MKAPQPDLEQTLDELADGLDAGWDVPESAPVSLTPHSAPLPAALDELDADWDAPVPAAAARSAQARPSAARPSQARPNPTRAVTQPAAPGSTPLHASKKDRREAERKRRAHEASQKAAQKRQRKAERRAEAVRVAEQARLAEAKASAERQAREGDNPSSSPKRAKVKAPKTESERSGNPKRVPKRVRHEHTRNARSIPDADEPQPKPAPIEPSERGAKKLILPLLIALLVAVTLGFALSRAR